jgi:N-acetyl-gamma-glutamyl-phosphate reductase
MRVSVAVVGVTGYSGLELIRILLKHPALECRVVMASESTGEKPVADIHPQLRGMSDLVCLPQNVDLLASMEVDTVFLCTPNEVSYELVPQLLARGMRVIDLSGSFRLREASEYTRWYGFSHEASDLLDQAVYGLPEWNAREIAGARLLANPGCYPTSVLLALLPAAKAGMLEAGSEIVCDSKSGVTGAGRSTRPDMLFGEVYENFRPYSPVTHRHAPEMCQELGWDLANFTFVPHLLPVNRGILSSVYVTFQGRVSSEEIAAEFRRRYERHPFVRILGSSVLPELRAVVHSNFCDIAWRLNSNGRRGIFFAALDNLVKGAAGQAVQNFNLMHQLDQGVGLMEGVTVEMHG